MDEAEEDPETLTTEVLLMRVHQAWMAKSTWQMWLPHDTRLAVAKK